MINLDSYFLTFDQLINKLIIQLTFMEFLICLSHYTLTCRYKVEYTLDDDNVPVLRKDQSSSGRIICKMK